MENKEHNIHLASVDADHIYWVGDRDFRVSTTKMLSQVWTFAAGNEQTFRTMKSWLNKISRVEENKNTDESLKLAEKLKEYVNILGLIEPIFDADKSRANKDGNYGHEYWQHMCMYGNIDNIDPALYTKDGETMGKMMYDAMVKFGKFEVFACEVALVDFDIEIGIKFDMVIKTEDGKYYLLDGKTGSPVIMEKLEKVTAQTGMYADHIQRYYNIEISGIYCVYGVKQEKEYKVIDTDRKRANYNKKSEADKNELIVLDFTTPLSADEIKEIESKHTGEFFFKGGLIDLGSADKCIAVYKSVLETYKNNVKAKENVKALIKEMKEVNNEK